MTPIVDSLWHGVTTSTPTSSSQGSGLQYRRVSAPNERALFVGYRLPEDKPIFTLRVRKSALPSLASLPKLGGVEVFGTVEGDSVHFGLMLRDTRNVGLFETFCRDLITHVAPCVSDSSAVAAFLTRLQGWQKFLERGGEGLSIEAERGLWGELFFLRYHLWPLIQQESIDLWYGPFGSPQDFKIDALAVEVKTVSPTSFSAKVSSEWQLDGEQLNRLFLFCLRLQEVENGESLPQLIDSLRELADEGHRKRFDDLLLEAGYFNAHATEYASHLFSPVGQVLFDVRDGFPCLTSSNVPAGVSRVSYYLDLNGCAPFQCDFDALHCFVSTPSP